MEQLREKGDYNCTFSVSKEEMRTAKRVVLKTRNKKAESKENGEKVG